MVVVVVVVLVVVVVVASVTLGATLPKIAPLRALCLFARIPRPFQAIRRIVSFPNLSSSVYPPHLLLPFLTRSLPSLLLLLAPASQRTDHMSLIISDLMRIVGVTSEFAKFFRGNELRVRYGRG